MQTGCDKNIDFFLGALGPSGGFRGYFCDLADQPDLWLYLIKAGPGCGKSTLMKNLARQAAGPVERIHCSSDPDSLDGVIFSSPRAAILDATAPHTLEPAYPGAKETVVNLFGTLDPQTLYQNRAEIIRLFDTCGQLQKSAGRCLASASLLLREQQLAAAGCLNQEKLEQYVTRLGRRLLPDKGRTGSEQLRLLSAITPQGPLCYTGTVETLASHKVVFRDEWGAAAPLAIQLLRQMALERGYDIYTCLCPLSQPAAAEHLLIPELGLAFLTSNLWHPMDFAGQQNIHCSRFMDRQALSCHKNRMRLSRRTAAELLEQTSAFQRQAKQTHDQLEEYYKSAADFEAVNAIGRATAKALGLE